MNVFELPADGELTRDMVREYGDTLTVRERIAGKNYGLGHLSLKDGHSALLELYDREDNTIKTHFEWTKRGAVIRMRTMRQLYAIGLRDEEIESIVLTKTPDDVYAVPYFPFWILLKLGVRLSVAKWFMLRGQFVGDRLIYGPGSIQLALTDGQMLAYQQDGSLWNDCLSTFQVEKIKGRVRIVDERRKVLVE